jgi:peptidoglycan/LPS O-acetylase OafA/YrhL
MRIDKSEKHTHTGPRTANNFDGLRLLGALMVLFSHQLALSGNPEPRIFDVKLGTLGVIIFFTISGYLVTASWERDPQFIRFAFKRLLRVWPALAVCLTICMALVCLVKIASSDGAVPTMLFNYLPKNVFEGAIPNMLFSYLPNYIFVWEDGIFFKGNPYKFLNGSLWTIPLEVQCYLAVMLLGYISREHLRMTLIGAILAIAAMHLTGNWDKFSERLPGFFQIKDDFNLPVFFLAGAVMYFIPKLRSPKLSGALVLMGLTALALGQTGITLFLLVPLFVVGVGVASWPALRDASHFGDLSYGIYLWAWPIEQLGVSVLGKQTPWPLLLALTVIATALMAYLSWHLVERRCLRLKPGSREVVR